MSYQKVKHSVNDSADSPAKQGVDGDGDVPSVVFGCVAVLFVVGLDGDRAFLIAFL